MTDDKAIIGNLRYELESAKAWIKKLEAQIKSQESELAALNNFRFKP